MQPHLKDSFSVINLSQGARISEFLKLIYLRKQQVLDSFKQDTKTLERSFHTNDTKYSHFICFLNNFISVWQNSLHFN